MINQKHKQLNQKVPSFIEAYRNGEIKNKEGYHKPDTQRRADFKCGCTKTTDKGTYRDITIKYRDMTIHYYHQHPIVVKTEEADLSISSCNHHTRTTKQRINRYLPKGYKVYQKDYTWYMKTPNKDDKQFEDGMTLSVEQRIIQKL